MQVQDQAQHESSALLITGPWTIHHSTHKRAAPPTTAQQGTCLPRGPGRQWPSCYRPIPSSGKTVPKPGPAQVRKALGSISTGLGIPPEGITVTDHDTPNSGIKKPLKVGAMGPQGIQHPTPLTSALPGSQDNIRPPQMALGDASTNISSLGCTPEPKHGGLDSSLSPGLAEMKLSGPRTGSLCAAFTVGHVVGARRG